MEGTTQAAAFLLGLGAETLTVWQMAVRAVVVYVIAIAVVRLGKKRFMGRATAFDLILVIVLGSMISRVITGSTSFFPGLAAVATLVAMHWLFSAIGVRWQAFNVLVKGHARLLVRDGQVDWEEMRRTHLTEDDLWEDLRAKGVSNLGEIAEAHLERSGQVSVLKRKDRAGSG